MSTFVYREPGKIVRDILIEEMILTQPQVLFTNQKYFIPTDGLFIVISYVGPSKVGGVQSEWVTTGSGLIERLSVKMFHLIQIDIMSYSEDARTRKEEIAMAMASIYSEQQQEIYSMWIASHIGAMIDTSFLEETKMLTRYTATVLTESTKSKEKPVEYYNDFSGEYFADNLQPTVPILVPPVNPMTP